MKFIRNAIIFAVLYVVFARGAQPLIAGFVQTPLVDTLWYMEVNDGAQERYTDIPPSVLKGNTSIKVEYDLHGGCLLDGDASALIFDQQGWKFVALSQYGANCSDGRQTILIPLEDFRDIKSDKPLDTHRDLDGPVHIRIWSEEPVTVEIFSIIAIKSVEQVLNDTVLSPVSVHIDSGIPTPAPVLSATPFPSPSVADLPVPPIAPEASPSGSIAAPTTWAIRSVDAMKQTKDTVCTPRNEYWIDSWLDKAEEIGANYIAISMPYDNPVCGNANEYAQIWIKHIRAHGMNVWHRQMPLTFEGIYNVPKSNNSDYLDMIGSYIEAHPQMYEEGDIFTPDPRASKRGIMGVTHCAQSVCQFNSKETFNAWLRNAMSVSKTAFSKIGKQNIKIGYFGFDGFVAWGDNNPDWDGILEDETIRQIGNITIDHYPEMIGSTMEEDLDELEQRYPGVDIIIGEWGTVTGGNTVDQVRSTFTAAQRPSIKGVNYWQFGPDGSGEQVINDDFSSREQFDEVKKILHTVVENPPLEINYATIKI